MNRYKLVREGNTPKVNHRSLKPEGIKMVKVRNKTVNRVVKSHYRQPGEAKMASRRGQMAKMQRTGSLTTQIVVKVKPKESR